MKQTKADYVKPKKVDVWQHERVMLKERIAALEAELAELKARDWRPIDGPETLPPDTDKQLLLTILVEVEGKEPYYHATKAWYMKGRWGVNDPDTGMIEPLEKVAHNRGVKVTPIAHAPWPAPYRRDKR